MGFWDRHNKIIIGNVKKISSENVHAFKYVRIQTWQSFIRKAHVIQCLKKALCPFVCSFINAAHMTWSYDITSLIPYRVYSNS